MVIMDTEHCPICKKQNNCMSSCMWIGSKNCWCSGEDIPTDLIDCLPDSYRDTACICKSCVENFRKGSLTKPELFIRMYTDKH